MAWISAKLTRLFLAHLVIPMWFYVIHNCCLFFLIENETGAIVFHNFQIRCKITKFISFFSKKVWKSSKKAVDKGVDIHVHKGASVLYTSYD